VSIAAALVLAGQAVLTAAAAAPQAPTAAPPPAVYAAAAAPMTAGASPMIADASSMTAGGGAETPPPPEAVVAVTAPATATPAAADLDQHRALVRRYYDQVWNHFNLDEASKIFAPPFEVEGIQDTITHMHYGIPDIHFELHDMVAEGDLVAVAFTASGTHSFELFGGAPTGNKIRFEGIEIFHFKDGRIVAKRTSYDRIGLLRQLGAPCKPTP
jgi:predicted ester cyclase